MGTISRLVIAAMSFALLAVISSCSGSNNNGKGIVSGLNHPPSTELPSLPGLDGERESSVISQVGIDPVQPLMVDGKTSVQGENYLLDSDAESLAWAMYAYPAAENDLFSLRVTFSYPNGPGAWVGLANYLTGRWDWKPKAILTQQIYQLSPTETHDYVSPQGNFYFIILSEADKDVLITDLLAVVDLPPPPTFTISGKVTDPNAGGVSGILIGLTPGGDQTTTDNSGNYSFEDLEAGNYTISPMDAGFDFTPLSRQVEVVSKDVADVNFVAEEIVQIVTYVADIAPLIDGTTGEDSCLECHAGQFPEEGLDFSTYEVVKENAAEINIEVNSNFDWMPKDGDKWSAANRQLFQDWIDGGLLEQ